ncbi:MAG: hypothetical protein LBM73_03210 [Candidatus Nomurabacteria bacterium]|jgi:hypothetical protein|nr:hypothetical protein [Candidatus Nomurabacteria bacterium]
MRKNIKLVFAGFLVAILSAAGLSTGLAGKVNADSGLDSVCDGRVLGTSDEHFNRVIPTDDGGWLAVGASNSSVIDDQTNQGGYDALIAKFDAKCDTQWTKLVGGSGVGDNFSNVAKIDGGYVAVGQFGAGITAPSISGLESAGSDVQSEAIKFDDFGNIAWGIKLDSDSNYALASNGSDQFVVGDNESNNPFVTAYDNNGNQLWQKSYSGEFTQAIAYDGSGYVLAMLMQVGGGPTGQDLARAKIDSQGNLLWQKDSAGGIDDQVNLVAEAIATTPDGGFVMAGYANDTGLTHQFPNGNAALLAKFDAGGNTQWIKTLVGAANVEYRGVAVDAAGNIEAVGDATGDISSLRITMYNNSAVGLALSYDESGALGRVIWSYVQTGGSEHPSTIYRGVSFRGENFAIVGGSDSDATLNVWSVKLPAPATPGTNPVITPIAQPTTPKAPSTGSADNNSTVIWPMVALGAGLIVAAAFGGRLIRRRS